MGFGSDSPLRNQINLFLSFDCPYSLNIILQVEMSAFISFNLGPGQYPVFGVSPVLFTQILRIVVSTESG